MVCAALQRPCVVPIGSRFVRRHWLKAEVHAWGVKDRRAETFDDFLLAVRVQISRKSSKPSSQSVSNNQFSFQSLRCDFNYYEIGCFSPSVQS